MILFILFLMFVSICFLVAWQIFTSPPEPPCNEEYKDHCYHTKHLSRLARVKGCLDPPREDIWMDICCRCKKETPHAMYDDR